MLELSPDDFNRVALYLEGFLFGIYDVYYSPIISFKLLNLPPPSSGIYSGIFAIFLNTALQNGTEQGKSIVFYALCVLYALSLAAIILDTMMFTAGVSENNYLCFKSR